VLKVGAQAEENAKLNIRAQIDAKILRKSNNF
jgi:hypothetical protein